MGYEIALAGGISIPVGTSQCWPTFTEWAAKLDPKTYPLLVRFAVTGKVRDPNATAKEIDAALIALDAPESVQDTGDRVSAILECHAGGKPAYIHNGMS
ncbi:MAG: hypothetical protein JWN86_2538 [Planctomycetota bacterium]|nr:hypothetical protein [Planctomycetota bacterium]